MLGHIRISNKHLKQPCPEMSGKFPYNTLKWVICGPETGPGARYCDPAWIEDLYRQCNNVNIPFFDKRKVGWLAREFPFHKNNTSNN